MVSAYFYYLVSMCRLLNLPTSAEKKEGTEYDLQLVWLVRHWTNSVRLGLGLAW